jgi:hypothetical protein
LVSPSLGLVPEQIRFRVGFRSAVVSVVRIQG